MTKEVSERVRLNMGNGDWMTVDRRVFVGMKNRDIDACVQRAPGTPGSWSWVILPWEDDPWAQDALRTNGAMSLEVIGNKMGFSRERARQYQVQGLRKLNGPKAARIAREAATSRNEAERTPHRRRRGGVWTSYTPPCEPFDDAVQSHGKPGSYIGRVKITPSMRTEIYERTKTEPPLHVAAAYGIKVNTVRSIMRAKGVPPGNCRTHWSQA